MAHGEGSTHHITPLKTYVKVLGALLVLTVITVGVATPVTGFDVGAFNAVLAMVIASIKAGLVLAIFMGLKYDDKLYLGIFLTGVFFLVLLFAFSVTDIYSRIFVNSTL